MRGLSARTALASAALAAVLAREQNKALGVRREELARAVDRLEVEKARVARYGAFGRRIATQTERGELARTIATELAELSGARAAVLYAAEEDAWPTVLAAVGVADPPPELPHTGPAAGALAAGESVALPSGAPGRLLTRTGAELAVPLAELAVPLVHAGATVGLLVLAWSGEQPAGTQDELADLFPPAAAMLSNVIALASTRRRPSVIRADRLKDEFFALVSHELRTPLTSVMGYLELVLDDEEPLAEDHRHYLEIVQRNATRLLRLVGDLLFVAQVEAGTLALDPGPVDLAAVTREAVDAARPRAESRSIALSAEIADSGPVWGDRDRLGQVLDNLVTNALKFTPSDGAVVVRLGREDGCTVLEVEDTGPGIALADQGRLFERFFRADSAVRQAVPGVGLGLTIVRAIAEAHGGTVEVASAVGEGTTFRVELPGRPDRPAV